MSAIPLFKEGHKGFTICDQGYTIRQSESYRVLHAGICWCRVALATAWALIGLIGLGWSLWSNKPGIVVVALAFLALLLWCYMPRKKRGAPFGAPRPNPAVERVSTAPAAPADSPLPSPVFPPSAS